MNKFYVYEHIRLDTGECFYIGKGNGSRGYSEKGRNKYWKRVVNKAKGFKCKIVAGNLTEQEAFNFEIALIDSCKTDKIKLCNIAKGGKGSSGFRHTKKHKIKMSEFMKKINPMHDEATKEKHKNAIKEAMKRPEVRQRISSSLRGKTFSEQHIENLRKSHTGKFTRGKSSSAKKVKFNNKIFNCVMDYADYVNIPWKTAYSRISRNPKKWGVEVLAH